MNGLQMIETLKATGSEAEFFARWAGYYAKTVNTDAVLCRCSARSQAAVPAFVQTLSTAAVLVLGGLKVMSGEMTVGMLVAYQTLLGSFTRPLNDVRAVRLDAAGAAGRHEPAGRRHALPGGSAVPSRTRRRSKFDPSEDQALRATSSCATSPSATARSRSRSSRTSTCRSSRAGAWRWSARSGSGKSTVAKVISGLYRRGAARCCSTACRATQLPRELVVELARGRRPGGVPLRRHGRRERHDVGLDDRRCSAFEHGRHATRPSTRSSRRARAATSRRCRKAAATSAAASASGSRSRGRSSASRRS